MIYKRYIEFIYKAYIKNIFCQVLNPLFVLSILLEALVSSISIWAEYISFDFVV